MLFQSHQTSCWLFNSEVLGSGPVTGSLTTTRQVPLTHSHTHTHSLFHSTLHTHSVLHKLQLGSILVIIIIWWQSFWFLNQSFCTYDLAVNNSARGAGKGGSLETAGTVQPRRKDTHEEESCLANSSQSGQLFQSVHLLRCFTTSGSSVSTWRQVDQCKELLRWTDALWIGPTPQSATMEELQRKLNQRYEGTKPRKVSYLWYDSQLRGFWSTLSKRHIEVISATERSAKMFLCICLIISSRSALTEWNRISARMLTCRWYVCASLSSDQTRLLLARYANQSHGK